MRPFTINTDDTGAFESWDLPPGTYSWAVGERAAALAGDLARHLDDEWVVAANCADALRKMGGIGLDLLQVRSTEDGYVGDLARQMLWERGAAAGTA